MSALPPKADMCGALWYVRFVPKADMSKLLRDTAIGIALLLSAGIVMKLPRRQFLSLIVGVSTAMTASGLALAQPTPAVRAKGPPVWLDMDQKELDDAYDQFVYAPNARQVIARCHRNSDLVRER